MGQSEEEAIDRIVRGLEGRVLAPAFVAQLAGLVAPAVADFAFAKIEAAAALKRQEIEQRSQELRLQAEAMQQRQAPPASSGASGAGGNGPGAALETTVPVGSGEEPDEERGFNRQKVLTRFMASLTRYLEDPIGTVKMVSEIKQAWGGVKDPLGALDAIGASHPQYAAFWAQKFTPDVIETLMKSAPEIFDQGFRTRLESESRAKRSLQEWRENTRTDGGTRTAPGPGSTPGSSPTSSPASAPSSSPAATPQGVPAAMRQKPRLADLAPGVRF